VPLHGPKGPLDLNSPDPAAILQLMDEPVEVLVNVVRRITSARKTREPRLPLARVKRLAPEWAGLRGDNLRHPSGAAGCSDVSRGFSEGSAVTVSSPCPAYSSSAM